LVALGWWGAAPDTSEEGGTITGAKSAIGGAITSGWLLLEVWTIAPAPLSLPSLVVDMFCVCMRSFLLALYSAADSTPEKCSNEVQ
jgi:hypothetical protein